MKIMSFALNNFAPEFFWVSQIGVDERSKILNYDRIMKAFFVKCNNYLQSIIQCITSRIFLISLYTIKYVTILDYLSTKAHFFNFANPFQSYQCYRVVKTKSGAFQTPRNNTKQGKWEIK